MKIIASILVAVLLIPSLLLAQPPQEEEVFLYLVKVTNLSKSLILTPFLVATHTHGLQLFQLGSPAIWELEAVAEAGDTGPLESLAGSHPDVFDVETSNGPVLPGETVEVYIGVDKEHRFVSLASMILPSNDGFIALNGVLGPDWHPMSYYSPGYDAGTERNSELCDFIPGPICQGEGLSPNDPGEGYVYIHDGIHGIADLDPATYDWKNPVALIKIFPIQRDLVQR